MTREIMAKIHFKKTEKKSLFQKRSFLFFKRPIQTVAVLLVAVCVFYIFRSIEHLSPSGEILVDRFSTGQYAASPEELSPSNRAQEGLRKKAASSPPSQQIPQMPAYKSLDMKPEYVTPSPPLNGDEETAIASDTTKRTKQTAPAGGAVLMGQISPAPRVEVKQQSLALAERTNESPNESFSSGPTARSREIEAMLIKKVGDYFYNHDLTLNGIRKDVKYGVSKFQALPENASWLDAGLRKKMASCKNIYLVDVLISETKQKYVYCADNVSIVLLFKVVRKNGRRIKTE